MFSYGLLYMDMRVLADQLCADSGCSIENKRGAMDDRDLWQRRFRELCCWCDLMMITCIDLYTRSFIVILYYLYIESWVNWKHSQFCNFIFCLYIFTQPLHCIWWWGPSNAGALGNMEHPFIAIAPKSTQARRGSTW